MNKINYQLVLNEILEKIDKSGRRPRLLLHACCAPCSSYVLEYLSELFDITLYFYNPNISPESEFAFRADELERLTREMPLKGNVEVAVEKYNSDEFYNTIAGYELEREGGARCKKCYMLRLERSAEYAKRNGYDYFTTTLSISPYKNSAWLNEIGEELMSEYGVEYLFSDFKKRNGYRRSCELSEEYGLYRQNYCGCEFSKRDSVLKNNT
ncbi:MAG: epoxyqueuosine reductase QueH [Clostridia bacterium]|nr:epoxyqueuosine reductase QueH [Clostridia bacterium]